MRTGKQFLAALQADLKTEDGFHHGLKVWVDDNSAAAKVLTALDDES